ASSVLLLLVTCHVLLLCLPSSLSRLLPPPFSTLFPYTTLFRSILSRVASAALLVIFSTKCLGGFSFSCCSNECSRIPCNVLISKLSFSATMISINLSRLSVHQLHPFLSLLANTLIVPSALSIGRNSSVSMPIFFNFSR